MRGKIFSFFFEKENFGVERRCPSSWKHFNKNNTLQKRDYKKPSALDPETQFENEKTERVKALYAKQGIDIKERRKKYYNP